jgi:hypothetical protein
MPARARSALLAPKALGTALLGALLVACAADGPRALEPEFDLHDPNPSVRAQAASEVGRLGSVEHVPAVIELLDDEDPAVRVMAGRTLADLTGRRDTTRAYAAPDDLRRQVEDWRAWWAGHGSTLGAPRSVAPRGRR